MPEDEESNVDANGYELPAHRVRLPGFISDKEVGLGDVIKRATTYLGIRPCEGCNRRAEALNRWMVFTSRKSR